MEKKLKIALVCDWFLPQIGGIETHLSDLAKVLQANGHEVQIITSLPGPEKVNNIKVHRLNSKLLPKYKIIWNLSPLRDLKKILIKENFDVVHSHAGIISPLAYGSIYISKKLSLPTILTTHSYLRKTGIVFFKCLDKLFYFSNWQVLFTSVSKSASNRVAQVIKNKKVPILYNGINPSDWKITNQFPQDKLRIISVLRLFRNKRPHDLIKAIQKICSRLPSNIQFTFTIIGDGPYKKKLLKKVTKLKIGDKVEFLGFKNRAEIREQFKQSILFLSPTTKEAFGISILEALCAGLPIVAMNQGGVKEIITHGKNGFLANNEKEFVDYTLKLIINKNLRLEFSKNTKEELNKYSWKQILNNLLLTYMQTIENTKKTQTSYNHYI